MQIHVKGYIAPEAWEKTVCRIWLNIDMLMNYDVLINV
jgi:hypothetical protein